MFLAIFSDGLHLYLCCVLFGLGIIWNQLTRGLNLRSLKLK